MSQSTKLYKNHVNSIGYWEISSEGNMIIIEHATTLGGAAITHHEIINSGLQGRTIEQQVQHRIQSRINKQLDKGYVHTLEEAKKPPTNALNLFQPMLAQPLKRVSNINFDRHLVQLKYNGHRCLITNHQGELIAYSRQGKIIDTIPHILESLEIPEGMTLDGELYAHGESLQTIASWAKRFQPNSSLLKYIVYDIIEIDSFQSRYAWLLNEFVHDITGPAIVAPTWQLEEELVPALNRAKSKNYEGLILRNKDRGYEPGRRSSSLIKIKSCMDAEFPVVDVIPSKVNWGILVCMLPNGNTFKVSSPGTVIEKRYVLENKEQYIGKLVTVEFAEYTKDKVPFHCVALSFREDI